MTAEQSTVHDWLRLIHAEYLEVPGLQLTKSQIQHLWDLEPRLCDVLVDSLLSAGVLAKTERDAYVLADL